MMTRTPGRSLAAAQTIPKPGDLETNLREHLRLIEAAAEQRVRSGLSRAVADGLRARSRRFALPSRSATPARTARRRGVGARHHRGRRSSGPDRIATRTSARSSSRRIAPSSSIRSACSARSRESARADGSCRPRSAPCSHPGDRDPLIRFGGHTAARSRCAPTSVPLDPPAGTPRTAAPDLFASMFVIPRTSTQERWNGPCDYAVRHSMAVVFANFGGPSGGLASGGRRAVVSENGEIPRGASRRRIGSRRCDRRRRRLAHPRNRRSRGSPCGRSAARPISCAARGPHSSPSPAGRSRPGGAAGRGGNGDHLGNRSGGGVLGPAGCTPRRDGGDSVNQSSTTASEVAAS